MSNLWGKWKSKIKNMFTYETEEIIEEEVQLLTENLEKKTVHEEMPPSLNIEPRYGQQSNQSDRIRMTYLYPENSPYKPDRDPRMDKLPVRKQRRTVQPVRTEPKYEVNNVLDTHEPLESRRNRRNMTINIDNNEKTEEHISLNGRKKWENEENRNRPQVSRSPFTPTEVPSPIYGFHPRHEGEGLPAFMRRKEEASDQVAAGTDKEPVYEDSVVIQAEPQEPQELRLDSAFSVEKPKIEKENPIHSSFSKLAVPVQEEKLPEDVVLTKEQSTAGTDTVQAEKSEPIRETLQVNRKEIRNEKEQNKVPFNVLMTDTDKLHEAHKQHKREQEVKQRFKQIISEANKSPQQPSQSLTQQREPLPIHLLDDPEPANHEDGIWVEEQKQLLEQTLAHFNVKAKVVNATQGPSVTKFEVQPELGVKVSKVKNLSDDLKLNLSAKDIRIEAPIPGKNTIGIEVPNPRAQTVGLQEIFESNAFQESSSPLTIGLGLSIEGSPVVTNIQKMPHGLIAGATGSGKSVCINTILLSLIYKASHEDVRLLLIDPKMVELASYNGIPHLVSPVITDVKAATAALKWAVAEMEDRYERFVKEGVREISRYNDKMAKQGRLAEKMPFLVIVIDELADLMMISPQDVEDSICRIAQKARACGIHLLLATQRPSVDVITGLIKANIPTRIAFSVSSQVDSRTIIDASGAERLLGKGDMLFMENGAGNTTRIQGAFVSDDEIERVANYARSLAPANYLFEQEELLARVKVDEDADELLEEAIDFIIEKNQASTSLLQRNFNIGYNRAARMMDTLEQRGIINQQNGSKPRDVLVSRAQLDEMLK